MKPLQKRKTQEPSLAQGSLAKALALPKVQQCSPEKKHLSHMEGFCNFDGLFIDLEYAFLCILKGDIDSPIDLLIDLFIDSAY